MSRQMFFFRVLTVTFFMTASSYDNVDAPHLGLGVKMASDLFTQQQNKPSPQLTQHKYSECEL